MVDVEKRRHPRYEVNDVEGVFLFDLEVTILNLSVAGMAVETHRSLTVGRRYSFTVQRGSELVKLDGRVAWSILWKTQKDDRGEIVPVYRAGVQFRDVLTDKAQQIQHLIEDNVVLDVNKRIFGRFRLGPGTLVKIDTEAPFVIQKISMSGMLVETPLVSEVNAVFPIEVNLKQGVLAGHGRVAFVMPAQSGEGPPQNQLGIEFVGLDSSSRILLERFIASVVQTEPPES